MKYKVTIVRIGYRHAEVEVDADDLRQAKHRALDMAGNVEFPGEHTSEYEATDVRPATEAA